MPNIDIYILLVLTLFILAFFLKNLLTFLRVRSAIRSSSAIVTFSIILTTVNYLIMFSMVMVPGAAKYLVVIPRPGAELLTITGCVVLALALSMSLAALYCLKNSWRVGILSEQKTPLVTSGVYRLSRNPYFTSYGLLFAGVLLIHPSVVLMVTSVVQMVVFHRMIRLEETYLERTHGAAYRSYRQSVGRYLTFRK